MKKVGDMITWNTKDGTATGKVVYIKVTYSYLVLVDGTDKTVIVTEKE